MSTEQEKIDLVMMRVNKVLKNSYFKAEPDQVLVCDSDYFSMFVKISPIKEADYGDAKLKDGISHCLQIDLDKEGHAGIGYGEDGDVMEITMGNIYSFIYWDFCLDG